jgi:4-deoxy-L-threo-5-hexosulose-uronate ketol-isomerase
MKTLAAHDRQTYARMTARQLRSEYVVPGLFVPGRIVLQEWETDRTVMGGICPLSRRLTLEAPASLKAAHFNDRREMGIINTAGTGAVTVDGRRFSLRKYDCLYVGRGARKVVFGSHRAASPARFYLLSYPAHAHHPTRLARYASDKGVALGARETRNQRTLYKVIHPDGVRSCQLVMGFTVVAPGSRWNTMPPHVHPCRSEVYLYFDLPARGWVTHFMGGPDRVRKLKLRDRQAVVSPPWSIHCGAGSTHYGFVWGMGGENQVFSDMDPIDPRVVR